MVKHQWQIQLRTVMSVAFMGIARVSSCLLNKHGELSGEFKSVSSCRAGFLREAAASELCCPSDCALSIVGWGSLETSCQAQCSEYPAHGQDSTGASGWQHRNPGLWGSIFPCKWAVP